MSVLRITDREVAEGRRKVEVLFTPEGSMRRSAESTFEYAVDESDSERIRWYLEEYPEYPEFPAPERARLAETRLAITGVELFSKVFSGGDAAGVWARLVDDLAGVRVEVDADPADTQELPWELLRDPGTGTPVALSAKAFVRTHLQAAAGMPLPDPGGDRLRVLLVICRPGGRADVPFRSVASRLVRGGANRMMGLDLDVLRPPTFAKLAQVLQGANDAGWPYHVVHFDGHGLFMDVDTLTDADVGSSSGDAGLSPSTYAVSLAAPARPGSHGYLIFENPDSLANQQLVDGPTVGRLLHATQVPVLVLNACRTAFTEARSEPLADKDAEATSDRDSGAAGDDPLVGDLHERIRAYGSLAAEVADAGVPGVVAMRYNVYVITAAQFMADLYAHLLSGQSLGQAATAARRALAADPARQVVATPVDLQDWVVPTVYEAAPLVLLTPEIRSAPLIHIEPARKEHGAGGEVGVPPAPDVGFFGRDETLLGLDRAFDNHQVVLLHAYAGSGKSTAAAEFARWYQASGGLNHPNQPEWGPGPILWTSFEHHAPLSKVLNTVGDTFADMLEAGGVHWQALTDLGQRRDVVLKVLALMPVLWVWDNVEPVTGFPDGTPSEWKEQEQNELADFLRDLTARTRCKVVLTSRRDEHDWLGDLATRVELMAMPMRESLQLTAAIIARRAQDTPRDLDWRPLLRYTAGNPLTMTVVVGLALRKHLTTDEEIKGFVARVRAGEVALEDEQDASLGRTRSLAASLAYGFTHVFTETERAQLAVLHLFRDTVYVDALRFMGDSEVAGADAVPALAGLTREAGTNLLDRAVEIGLLTDLEDGFYGIHPALPWYFNTQFTRHHGTPGSPAAEACGRAYTRSFAAYIAFYFMQAQDGHETGVAQVMAAEEANMLHALDLARGHRLHGDGIDCLQGLQMLYEHKGRTAEWARLLDKVTPDYIDPAAGGPLPGREDDYSIISGYRVSLAVDAQDWATAARLQQATTDWARGQAHVALGQPPDQLDPEGRNRIRSLAVCLQLQGIILTGQSDPGCLRVLQEAFKLCQRIGLRDVAAKTATSIGNAYMGVPALRDVEQAQRWHKLSLDIKPEHDRLGQAVSQGQLAAVAFQRFRDAMTAGAPQSILRTHLDAVVAGYRRALALTPVDHPEFLAISHSQLGNAYSDAGDFANALTNYQQALRYKESRGDVYGAAQTRYNIAILYEGAARHDDAVMYARAALDNFRALGSSPAARTALTQDFIRELARLIDQSTP